MNAKKSVYTAEKADGTLAKFILDVDLAAMFGTDLDTVRRICFEKHGKFKSGVMPIPPEFVAGVAHKYPPQCQGKSAIGFMSAGVYLMAIYLDTPEAEKVCNAICREIGRPVAPGIALTLTLKDFAAMMEKAANEEDEQKLLEEIE